MPNNDELNNIMCIDNKRIPSLIAMLILVGWDKMHESAQITKLQLSPFPNGAKVYQNLTICANGEIHSTERATELRKFIHDWIIAPMYQIHSDSNGITFRIDQQSVSPLVAWLTMLLWTSVGRKISSAPMNAYVRGRNETLYIYEDGTVSGYRVRDSTTQQLKIWLHQRLKITYPKHT